MGLASGGVSVAVHGGIGGDDEDVAVFEALSSSLGAGFDHADDGNGGDGFLDVVEGEGAGGVAGDDEVVGALFFNQKTRALSSVASDGAAGLGAVGESGGVTDEGVVGLRARAMRARRTVRPPKPESKTPMVGVNEDSFTECFLGSAVRRRSGRCG